MKIIHNFNGSSVVAAVLAMCLRASMLHGAAYNSVTGGTNTVVAPNDADSPYTLAEIAEDIGDSAVFAWYASSNTAICNAHLCMSGTLHIGMVAGDGSYNAGGNEEKLLMTTNANYAINVAYGGGLIARGVQGTYGVRRTGADVLTNEISLIPQIYNFGKNYYALNVSNGCVILHDTKVSWSFNTMTFYGINIAGGEFDIQRCQLYNFQHKGPAIGIDFNNKTYTTQVFRDNFLGNGNNAGGDFFNRAGIRITAAGQTLTNFTISNCEFDANDNTAVASYSGNIMNYYARGLLVVDCKFNRGCPALMQSTAANPAQMEFRNCEFTDEAIRTPYFADVGHTSTWARFTYYMNCHVVNKSHPEINIDTGDDDVIVEEQTSITNQASIFKLTDGEWSVATNRASIGTDATGWTPSPANDGAILLTEVTFKRLSSLTSTNYYYYNLKITNCPPSYLEYDYYTDYGSNYVTSVDNVAGEGDKSMSINWFRADPAIPNSTPFFNNSPTNGTWGIGIEQIPSGTIFSFR